MILDSSMVEHSAVNRVVVGSSPTRGAEKSYYMGSCLSIIEREVFCVLNIFKSTGKRCTTMKQEKKPMILIADDSEMNRSILMDMLEEEYDIVEAENGAQAVALLQQLGSTIALVLLDIVMPEMDGFEVLSMMNKYHWIEDIPVIIISSETSSSALEHAYELGVTDYISRPFDELIVHRRVINTILLYAKQKRLMDLVADQILEKEKRSTLMIDILSHIVEFRNGESGMHVLHIRAITELLLKRVLQKTDKYPLSHEEVELICTASALHDIGKIAIPSEVLNKPGKFTDEEFAIMKTHSAIGDSMLEQVPFVQDEPLVRVAREICRWHHERYDGRGYPDGLKGDEIPVSAQIVALADVYDALTSERVYKKAFSHEKAKDMIVNGECGTFNPLLLDCLLDVADDIKEVLTGNTLRNDISQKEIRNIAEEMLDYKELATSERTLRALEHERIKYQFFASMSNEIHFEYTTLPPMVTVSAWGAEQLGVKEITMDPLHDETFLSLGRESIENLIEAFHKTTPENPVVQSECQICVKGEFRWYRIVSRTMWSSDETPEYQGVIGKAVDIHDEHTRIKDLERVSSHDGLTGLLNQAAAPGVVQEKLREHPEEDYAMFLLDLDYFKTANDQYGHIFGNHVLQYFAEKLRQSVRSEDIIARVGGDEFLLFLQYKEGFELAVERIFHSLSGEYGGFKISVSMGIARKSETVNDYETLFQYADQALYAAKNAGRGQYCFYNDSMVNTLSVISPIDFDIEEGK